MLIQKKEGLTMIKLTKLNDTEFVLNSQHIQVIESIFETKNPREDGVALDHQVDEPVGLFRAYRAADVHHLRRELPGLPELLHHRLETFVGHRLTPYRNP